MRFGCKCFAAWIGLLATSCVAAELRGLQQSLPSMVPEVLADYIENLGFGPHLNRILKGKRKLSNNYIPPSASGEQGLFPNEMIFILLATILIDATPRDFDLSNKDICPVFEDDRKFGIDLITLLYTGYHDFFQVQSLITNGDDAETPGLCTTSFIAHDTIKQGMADLPVLQTSGEAYRGNELGLFRFNFRTFEYCLDLLPEEEQDFCGIVLGLPKDDHERIRPRMDYLWGDGREPGSPFSLDGPRWSKEDFLDSASTFLEGKTALNLPDDADSWTIKELHRQALGIDLPDEQVQNFLSLQSASLLLAIAPSELVDLLAEQFGTSVAQVNGGKRAFVELYKTILPSIFPELAGDDIELSKTAMALLDSFLFAGGASVPSTIKNGLAAFFQGLTPKGEKFSMNDPKDLGLLVLETVRSYPPVLGVPYINTATGQRYAPLAGMAGYDKNVYGRDADEFRIRGDLSYYHARSLNWADAALPVDGVPGSSHVCPGRSMSYSMIVAFWEALQADRWCVNPDTPIVKETGPTFWSDFTIRNENCG